MNVFSLKEMPRHINSLPKIMYTQKNNKTSIPEFCNTFKHKLAFPRRFTAHILYKQRSILFDIYIYIYETCPPCPVSGVVVSRVEYSYFRVLRVPCPRIM